MHKYITFIFLLTLAATLATGCAWLEDVGVTDTIQKRELKTDADTGEQYWEVTTAPKVSDATAKVITNVTPLPLRPLVEPILAIAATLSLLFAGKKTREKANAEGALGKVVSTNTDVLDSTTLKGVKDLNAKAMSKGEKKALKLAVAKV